MKKGAGRDGCSIIQWTGLQLLSIMIALSTSTNFTQFGCPSFRDRRESFSGTRGFLAREEDFVLEKQGQAELLWAVRTIYEQAIAGEQVRLSSRASPQNQLPNNPWVRLPHLLEVPAGGGRGVTIHEVGRFYCCQVGTDCHAAGGNGIDGHQQLHGNRSPHHTTDLNPTAPCCSM